ncbi:MAG: RNase adapter RapZ [Acidobacteria bacterium]|nr:RNase adapter RapZ [Acidobacteriota bacterium]
MSLRIIIITGLSGSGKHTAIKAFEDLGYFCIDNLPVALIPTFIELCRRTQENITQAALVIDARERQFLTEFPPIYEQLQHQVDIELKMVFLEASDEALQVRFSETRRPHPLVETVNNLLESIRAEKKLLAPIRDLASIIVDTSEHTVHTLRRYFVEEFATSTDSLDMNLTIMSFGHKHGIPVALDLLFDVRFLPNPHFVPELRPLTGRHTEVTDYMLTFQEVRETIDRFGDLLEFLVPRYKREGRSYLTIGVGCTGGQHRSVMVSETLAERLRKAGYKARATHRDVSKR